MAIETIDTPEGTYTIETRFTADGSPVRTMTFAARAGTRTANEDTIRDRMATAVTANTAYLSLANPTAAQNTAQLQRLTREITALLKLALDDLGDVGGT